MAYCRRRTLSQLQNTDFTGYTGSAGTDGTSIVILGSLTNESELPLSGNNIGDCYIIEGNLYFGMVANGIMLAKFKDR